LIHFATFGWHFFVCRKAIDNVKPRPHTSCMALTPEKKVKNKVVALLKERLFRQKPHSANPTASWDKLVEIALSLQCSHSFLTVDERAELKAKIQSVQGDMFTKAVMRTLFAINGDDSSGDT
jgi:hypothetical protein